MIEKATGYKSGERWFAFVEEAQRHEIEQLLLSDLGNKPLSSEIIAQVIVGLKDKIVDALTMSPKARPAARKVNGGTKPRKPKPVIPAA